MKRKLDWYDIQKRYDEGFTILTLCKEFDCSPGAFESARKRGKFVTRNKSLCQTRRHDIVPDRLIEIAKLYNDGKSYREILKTGFAQAECNAAKEQGYFIPRTGSEAGKLRIKKFGQTVMSRSARDRLSERQSTNNSGGKSKRYIVAGQNVQGTWERDVAIKFEELKIKWTKLKVNKDILKYEMNGKIHSYTPDFYLPDYNIYLEIKGYWWGNDKQKMDIVLETHKDKRIIIIEKDDYNRILQGELVWLFQHATENRDN